MLLDNRRAVFAVGAAIAFLSGLTVVLTSSRSGFTAGSPERQDSAASAGASQSPLPSGESGEPTGELVLVFVGSDGCSWCRRDEVVEDLAHVTAKLGALAAESGLGFTRIGVAIDQRPTIGADYLRWVGDFDQMIAGGGWNNDGVRRYAAGRGVPQLVVLKRKLIWNSLGFIDTIDDEEVVARKIGVYEISDWVDAGVPVPDVEAVPPGG